MVQIGAPDFASAETYADEATYVNGTFTTHAIGDNFGVLPVSSWNGIAFSGIVHTAPVRMVFNWSSDEGGLNRSALYEYTITAGGTGDFNFVLPVVGAYLEVDYFSNADQANNLSIAIIGTKRPGRSFTPITPVPLLAQFGTAIGAGATINSDLNYLYGGPVHVFIGGAPATGEYRIDLLNLDGTRNSMVLRRSFPVPTQFDLPTPVYVPPGWLRFVVVNTTGAASSYTATVAPAAWSDS